MAIPHDPIFKEFFHRFFREFMEIFFPAEAAQLDFATLKWIEQELISNFPDQIKRVSDLIGEIALKNGGQRVILIHLEVEANRPKTLPNRMFEYYGLLRALRQKPVLPLALVLQKNVGGLLWQAHRETLLGHTIVEFHYGQVGLFDLDSFAYLKAGNPISSALATLMSAKPTEKPQIKFEALNTIVKSALTQGDKLFLINVMQTYLPTEKLAGGGEEMMEAIHAIEGTWLSKETKKAIKKGLQQGLEQGLQQGKHLGELKGKKEMLLRLLQRKFGSLPLVVETQLERIHDPAVLDQLSEQVMFAETLAEIQWPAAAND